METKAKKYIADSIKSYLIDGLHQDVIIEFTINTKSGLKKTNLKIVDDGCKYFAENGFKENGLKSFIKVTKVGQKHGYVIFETKRITNILEMIDNDLENIQKDLKVKIES